MQVKSLSGAILPNDTQFDEWAWGNLIYGFRVHYREFQVRWFRRSSSQKEEDGFHLTEDQKQHLIFHSMLSNFVLDENMAEGIRHHIVEEIKRDIEAKLQVLVDEEW